MMGRLGYIRSTPAQMLDAGCGSGDNLPLLREKYPQAAYTGLDHSAGQLAQARQRFAPSGLSTWVGRLTGRGGPATTFVEGDLAHTGLAPQSQDLVWSNLAMHWHPEPHAVLAEWSRLAKVDGLVMFSCLGPSTLRELRDALVEAGLTTATPTFVDMHDFGDLLIEHGFTDPVMDQETLTLTYRTPEKLLADVRALGGNPSMTRRSGLTARGWTRRLMAALDARRGDDGLIRLTVEVAYGHAWRAGARRLSATETTFSVDAIGGRTRRSD
ncbi:MAG: methyltransferase domain-containing protein, partial [Burkholderiaceae bacterium]|nr:methyltransferase domain-containing protein [Burkholderiaceae bacterium]